MLIVLKLLLLFTFILIINKCLIRINYSKIFRSGSSSEIYILNIIISIVIGYLFYKAILEIYYLSSNIL